MKDQASKIINHSNPRPIARSEAQEVKGHMRIRRSSHTRIATV